MSKDRQIDPLDQVPDEAEGAQYVPSSAGSQGAARDAGDDDREDPSPDQVPGRDDAGARGRDRDSGGWGDRGIGGGRAGGTGL